MARVPLQNTGDVDTEIESSFVAGEEVGGFAPGVAEQITQGSNDTEQDIADQHAAGVGAAAPKANGSNNPPAAMSVNKLYAALKTRVLKLGAQHGAGKTSMIGLAEEVTEAAAGGFITIEQVEDIYDKFREGVIAKSEYSDAGIVPDEATLERLPNEDPDKSRAQQLSKLRSFVKLGSHDGYRDDAVDLMRRARNTHIELLRQGDRKTLKQGSTYTIMVSIATAQLKAQDEAVKAAKAAGQKTQGVFAPVLTDADLARLMSVEAKEDRILTGADKILNAIKEASAARDGGKDRNPVPSDALDNAINWLKQALASEDPAMLDDYHKALDDAEQKRIDAETRREEAAAEKARKALEPKAPKPTKAERQAALATTNAA